VNLNVTITKAELILTSLLETKNNLFTAQLKSDTRNQINSFKFVFVP